MKYFHNVFTILVVGSFLTIPPLLSMEHIITEKEPYIQWSLSFEVGMRSFSSSGELQNRSVYQRCTNGAFFSVYDGSDDVTSYLAKNFHTQLANRFNSTVDNFNHCFKTADDWAKINGTGGSMVLIALLTGRVLTIAHCGNSRAIIFKISTGREEILFTHDHELGNDPYTKKEEYDRVHNAGGAIYRDLIDGAYTLEGRFRMSRAIGYYLKPNGLIADPDINKLTIDPSCKFMILVSRGISKVIDNDEAVRLVSGVFKLHGKPEKAAQRLIDEAYKKKSQQDLIAVVVRFIWKQDLHITSNTFSQ